MHNRLVIAEKPSVARSIAAALGASNRGNGYIEGGGWLVSWCFGHLAELADPAVYDEKYAKWRMADLPIIPDSFRFTIAPDKRKQFDVLRALLRREDVAEVVNACDAGREGELIFRTVYDLAGCTKPVKRLWLSSMEESTIRDGFENLRGGHDYDGLYHAALCRAKADWLVGINASRFFSLTYGPRLNVGRVMSPTLALLVQREVEISAFTPEPFYTVQLDCGVLTAATGRMTEKANAEKIVVDCTKTAVVRAVERRERTAKAPALYDLTTLQRDANRLLGYTAQQTLDYLQALYEKKLCTYPRTDSRYLTGDMEANIPAHVAAAAAVIGANVPPTVNAKQVCDSGKVSDHHAVIPTTGAGGAEIDALPLGEREILRLVSLGLLRAVSGPYRYAETVVTLDCAGHSFTAKGKSVLDPGWKIYEKDATEVMLPTLTEGETLTVAAATVREGKTTPAKHYTEDSILCNMETVGADEMPDGAERNGIGTPATRAGILEKLVSSGFVERRKAGKAATLIPTETGAALITVLPESLQSPLLTAEWEQRLKQVERGKLAPEAFMDGIAALLRELIRTYKPVPGAEVLFPSDKEVVGQCPRCGRRVTESGPGFFCESHTCGFALWKNSRFFSAKKKELTNDIAAALLRDGRVELKDCWSERTGRSYDATVVLDDDGKKTDYVLEFQNRRE